MRALNYIQVYEPIRMTSLSSCVSLFSSSSSAERSTETHWPYKSNRETPFPRGFLTHLDRLNLPSPFFECVYVSVFVYVVRACADFRFKRLPSGCASDSRQ